MSDASDSTPLARSLLRKSETFQGLFIVILRQSTSRPLCSSVLCSMETTSGSPLSVSSRAAGTCTP